MCLHALCMDPFYPVTEWEGVGCPLHDKAPPEVFLPQVAFGIVIGISRIMRKEVSEWYKDQNSSSETRCWHTWLKKTDSRNTVLHPLPIYNRGRTSKWQHAGYHHKARSTAPKVSLLEGLYPWARRTLLNTQGWGLQHHGCAYHWQATVWHYGGLHPPGHSLQAEWKDLCAHIPFTTSWRAFRRLSSWNCPKDGCRMSRHCLTGCLSISGSACLNPALSRSQDHIAVGSF